MRRVTSWLTINGKFILAAKPYPENIKRNEDFLREQIERFERDGYKTELRPYPGRAQNKKHSVALFVEGEEVLNLNNE